MWTGRKRGPSPECSNSLPSHSSGLGGHTGHRVSYPRLALGHPGKLSSKEQERPSFSQNTFQGQLKRHSEQSQMEAAGKPVQDCPRWRG